LKIDFKTVTIGGHTGYGNASRLLVQSLENQGVEIRPGSSVMLNFCMPNAYDYSDVTIGYTPWESTEVPVDWRGGLRAVDELWTTSSWTKEVLSAHRGDDIFVLPHGIEDIWIPRKRSQLTTPFTFLHMGEPAVRKGGDIVLEAWHKAFRHRKDVRLIYKCVKYPMCRVKDRTGSIIASPGMIDNVQTLGQVMTQEELLNLFYKSHCMVYPSRGEGFGLIPFQALATGMPTILPEQGGTSDFAGYSNLKIKNSTWIESGEDRIHPGLWMDHDVDEVIALMEEAVESFAHLSEDAFVAAEHLHMEYSWSKVAAMAEERLRAYV
jgi:glycosyltransferase involved in cell wall biosynthesis